MFLFVARFESTVCWFLADFESFVVCIVLPRVIMSPCFKLPLYQKITKDTLKMFASNLSLGYRERSLSALKKFRKSITYRLDDFPNFCLSLAFRRFCLSFRKSNFVEESLGFFQYSIGDFAHYKVFRVNNDDKKFISFVFYFPNLCIFTIARRREIFIGNWLYFLLTSWLYLSLFCFNFYGKKSSCNLCISKSY